MGFWVMFFISAVYIGYRFLSFFLISSFLILLDFVYLNYYPDVINKQYVCQLLYVLNDVTNK